MTEPARFEVLIPKDQVSDEDIAGLLDKARAKLVLGYIPADAKRNGASFGFCDVEGWQKPKAEATHFGWTASKGEAS